MKCSVVRKVFCTLLLALLALSPAYCGWRVYKEASPDSSVGSSTATQTVAPVTPTQSVQPTTPSTEAPKVSAPTESVLKNSSDSVTSYGEKVDEAEAVIAKAETVVAPEAAPVIEEMKQVLDDLEEEQVRIEENYKTVSATVVEQANVITEQDRLLSKPRFALGGELEYQPMLTLSPMLTMGVMQKHTLFYVKVGVDLDLEKPRNEIFNLGPQDLRVGIGGMYIF